MGRRDIIVIGGSAGAVRAVTSLVQDLPPDLPAAVFVCLHFPATARSALADVLRRYGPLPAAPAEHGEPVVPGRILVVPPDTHLLFDDGKVVLSRGPRENGHRPAIDPVMRSAAHVYGPRVVGVILSGMLDDGTAGMLSIQQRGGATVVQDPIDAEFPSMPVNTMKHVAVDHVVPVADMGKLLTDLVTDDNAFPDGADTPMPELLEQEDRIVALDPTVLTEANRPGTPSGFTCPDCNGVLWELDEGDLLRFRCRTGHAWTVGSLAARQETGVEAALWAALRALEDSAALAERLAERSEGLGRARSRFEAKAALAHAHGEVIRQLLLGAAAHDDLDDGDLDEERQEAGGG